MGRYRKYQPSNSTSAVGMSMGSPRLVARNMSFQMAREIPPRDPMSDLARESPSYANAPNPHMNFSSRPSPILGRRAMGPPPQASPKSHRRQPSELLKQEVKYFISICDSLFRNSPHIILEFTPKKSRFKHQISVEYTYSQQIIS